MLIIGLYKMPKTKVEEGGTISFKDSSARLSANSKYREGVIAQVFYVACKLCVGPLLFNMQKD